jgi:Thioredoxin-like
MRWFLLPVLILLIAPLARAADDAFVEGADARAEVEAAMVRAAENGTRALLVFGANWCHDSHGLVDHFQQDDMRAIIQDNYELVYIDVGWRHRNLDLMRELGAWTIYGTPTVLIVDPELGLMNESTMHYWHMAYSRPHADVVRYFRQLAFARPGGGVVENSQTYANLVADIEAWEIREGTRLSNAYVMLQDWRATLDDEFAAAGNDDEATRIVELYHSVESDIDHHRGRVREDRTALYTAAREAVRDAMFELGSNLNAELADQLDASNPDLQLEFPDYGEILFPWEDDGWAL